MKAHPLILALLLISLVVAGCMALTPEEAAAPAPVVEIDRSKPRKPIKTTDPVVKTPPRITR